MKILITGFSGFVARHFLYYLDHCNIKCEICGLDINEPKFDISIGFSDDLSICFQQVNLLNVESLNRVFEQFTPDYILHLASFSSVSYSWKYPTDSFLNNSVIFLNLIDMVKKYNPQCRILSVGSSEEYGNVEKENLPIRENQPLNPLSPYAVARVAQEHLSLIYADSFHFNIMLTRSFNHIGPGQDSRFVVPALIERVLNIKKKGMTSGQIDTGNLNIIRDFVDVRDVVKAYYLILTKGKRGNIYNVCSGRRISLKEILGKISSLTGVEVDTVLNSEYVRPKDNMEIVGSYYKLQSELSWEPEIALDQTLGEMITYMEKQLGFA